MEINGLEVNTMYVEHVGDGTINLYGSHYDVTNGLKVFRSTKNQELAGEIYNGDFTNERFIKQLKSRPTHNFIWYLSGPISMPIDMARVTFVD